MARWQARTPKETMESQKERLTRRIDEKKAEIKDLEDQRKGLDKAIAAMSQ
jgi:cell division protein FtsB